MVHEWWSTGGQDVDLVELVRASLGFRFLLVETGHKEVAICLF
jgi:hypothetical protein